MRYLGAQQIGESKDTSLSPPEGYNLIGKDVLYNHMSKYNLTRALSAKGGKRYPDNRLAGRIMW